MKPARKEANVAVVIGGFINGLGLVRSLAAMNYRVVVITTQPHDIAQHSRYVSEHHSLDALHDQLDGLAELLENRAKSTTPGCWAGALVFPTNDEAIAGLHKHRERLARCYQLVIPAAGCVPFLLNKTPMMAAAAEVGIPLPESYGRVSEWTRQDSGISFPVAVKPVRAGEFYTRFGRRLFIARDCSALESIRARLDHAGVEGELFDWIPGPDHNIQVVCLYVGRNGEPVAECTVRKLRQSPPGFGVARVAELTKTPPLLRQHSVELLRHIGLTGFAAIEFKRDERDGEFRFIEVNGRSVIYNTLLEQGGLNITHLTVSDSEQGGVAAVMAAQWPGAWVNLHADLLRSMQNWRREDISTLEYFKPYTRKKVFAVWSARDSGPFRALWMRSLRQLTSRFFGRSERHLKVNQKS